MELHQNCSPTLSAVQALVADWIECFQISAFPRSPCCGIRGIRLDTLSKWVLIPKALLHSHVSSERPNPLFYATLSSRHLFDPSYWCSCFAIAWTYHRRYDRFCFPSDALPPLRRSPIANTRGCMIDAWSEWHPSGHHLSAVSLTSGTLGWIVPNGSILESLTMPLCRRNQGARFEV